MKFNEAIEALQEGKKVRQKHYAKGVYLHMGFDGYIYWHDGEKYRGLGKVNLMDEWEIYSEEEEVDNRKDAEEIIKALFVLLNDEGLIVRTAYHDYIDEHNEVDYLECFREQLIEMNKYYKLLDE